MIKCLKNLIKTLQKKHSDTYYSKVNVVCDLDNQTNYVSRMLAKMFGKLNCRLIYFGSDTMYVDTPYVYMRIKFVHNYRVDEYMRSHEGELFISGYLVEDLIEKYTPKKAFKKLFKKEVSENE